MQTGDAGTQRRPDARGSACTGAPSRGGSDRTPAMCECHKYENLRNWRFNRVECMVHFKPFLASSSPDNLDGDEFVA